MTDDEANAKAQDMFGSYGATYKWVTRRISLGRLGDEEQNYAIGRRIRLGEREWFEMVGEGGSWEEALVSAKRQIAHWDEEQMIEELRKF